MQEKPIVVDAVQIFKLTNQLLRQVSSICRLCMQARCRFIPQCDQASRPNPFDEHAKSARGICIGSTQG